MFTLIQNVVSKVLQIFLVLACFSLVMRFAPVLASECADPTGFCMDAEKCLDFIDKNPGVTWEHTDDCKASDGLLCCRPSAEQPKEPVAPAKSTPAFDAQLSNKYNFPDPFDGKDLPRIVQNIITSLLSIVGALFFVMFLWGGFTWMTAGGDSKRVQKATQTLTNAVIGLVIIAMSYILVNAVVNVLAGAQQAGPTSAETTEETAPDNKAPSTDANEATPPLMEALP